MAFISLKWFAGMIPRRGRQHLPEPHATEAENCNLYSGELRPLHKPALAHQFCSPTDDCWRQPLPEDPSVIPDPPPEPPQCIPVVAQDIGFDACKVYECDSYSDAVIASSPVAYYPMNRPDDIANYPTPASITDYSTYANHTLNSQAAWSVQAVDDPFAGSTIDNCSGKVSLFQTAPAAGTGTTVLLRNVGGVNDGINEYPTSTEWTYLVHHPNSLTTSQAILGEFKYRNPSNATIGQGTLTRLGGLPNTFRLYFAVPGAASQIDIDMDANFPNWQNSVVGFIITFDGNDTRSELIVDFVRTGIFAPTRTGQIAGTGGDEILSHTGYFSQSELQESVLWNRALTDNELLGLKDEWDRNKTTYVDPDPTCADGTYLPGPIEGGTVIQIQVDINADATPPIQYQWYKDNIALPGEVGPVLTYTLQPEDSNASFNVLVQNPCGQQVSNAITVGEVTNQPICKAYECDAYGDAVLALSPVVYLPMNRAVDLDGYPSSIKDYSTYANDLPWTSSGSDLQDPADQSDIDTCSARVTRFANGAQAQLTSGINEWPPSKELTFFINNQWNGTSGVMMDFQMKNSIGSGGATGVKGFWNGNGTIKWDVNLDNISSRDVIVDVAAVDANWWKKIIGFRLTETGGQITVETFLDWVVIDTDTFTGTVYNPANYGGINVASALTGMAWQEYALFNRALTNDEIAGLKDAWEQNKTTYVDPNPNCRLPE